MSDNRSTLERFMDFVRSDWHWMGRKDKDGYGKIGISKKSIQAHRASYALFNGPIPEGMCVLHSCDDPGCVDPEHLHLGTIKDNNRETLERGRRKYQLNLQQAEEIKVLLSQHNFKIREIASMYGVSNSAIGMISCGKNWRSK